VSDEEASSDLMKHFNMSMSNYMKEVDGMIIGRKLMEVLSSFNLTPNQWPYGDRKTMIENEDIGQDDVTDYLSVGFSSTFRYFDGMSVDRIHDIIFHLGKRL